MAYAAAQGVPAAGDAGRASAAFLAEARKLVLDATLPGTSWRVPSAGPAAVPGKLIALMAEDLRNGGVLGVAQGVREAAAAIGWTLKIFNSDGTVAGRRRAFELALAAHPDGLIVCGADAVENAPALAPFAARKTAVVGWHAGPVAGPVEATPVAMNVTTDPLAVARVTAMAAVAQSNGRAGVVILTDSRYGIAMTKARAMERVIRACGGCRLLATRDIALSADGATMRSLTRELLDRYGAAWTHTLAINDLYFDHALPVLTTAGVRQHSLLSAGDGSAPAFMRIHAGTFQSGTVAEPLNLHGWQLVDELNRLFAGAPVSRFVAPVHLVDASNIGFDGGARLRYDPDNGYRDAYRRIWKR
jgi:ribose transport system substrate-binding protein